MEEMLRTLIRDYNIKRITEMVAQKLGVQLKYECQEHNVGCPNPHMLECSTVSIV